MQSFPDADKCYSKIYYDDVYRHRWLPRYPLIIRHASPLDKPLDIGCSVCKINTISLEENGMCRVCDFAHGFFENYPRDQVFHSLVIIAGKPRVVSRYY